MTRDRNEVRRNLDAVRNGLEQGSINNKNEQNTPSRTTPEEKPQEEMREKATGSSRGRRKKTETSSKSPVMKDEDRRIRIPESVVSDINMLLVLLKRDSVHTDYPLTKPAIFAKALKVFIISEYPKYAKIIYNSTEK